MLLQLYQGFVYKSLKVLFSQTSMDSMEKAKSKSRWKKLS